MKANQFVNMVLIAQPKNDADSFDYLGLFAFIAFVNFCVWTFAWLFFMDSVGNPKDWLVFWDTANLWASGSYEKLYPGLTPNFPFFYPPFFPLFVYPLSFLSRSGAYVAIVAIQVLLILLSFILLHQITSLRAAKLLKLFVISLSSASWLVAMPLGQISATFLFLIVLSLRLHMTERRFIAGIVLALLMLKPNIGIVFPCLFALRRDLRTLAGWLAGFSVLCLVPTFYDKDLWWHYLSFASKIGEFINKIPPWKHHTLHAFFRSALPGQNALTFALWLICSCFLAGFCLYVWHLTKEIPGILPRLYGMAVLTVVVCNPYFYHYDAILIVLPAIVFFSRNLFSSVAKIMCFFSAFVLQQIGVLYLQGGLSLVAIPLTCLLTFEMVDLMHYKNSKDCGTGVSVFVA